MIDAMVLIDEVRSLEIYKLPKNLKGSVELKSKSFLFLSLPGKCTLF